MTRVRAALTLLWCLSILIWTSMAKEAIQQPQTDPLQHVLSKYLDNEELEAHMNSFVRRCKPISRLTSIGKSVNGR
jgi:hypothetical protein